MVPAYELLSTARDMPKDLAYLRVRTKTEQFRLLDWARVVHISEREEELFIGNAGKALVLDVLEQQRTQILYYHHIDARLKKGVPEQPIVVEDVSDAVATLPLTAGDDGQGGGETVESLEKRFPQTTELLKRCLKYVDSTRQYPARLRWATQDKAKVEGLIFRLTELNNFLTGLLSANQLQNLSELQVCLPAQVSKTEFFLDFQR